MTSGTVSAHSLRKLLQAAAERGLPRKRVMRGAGMDELTLVDNTERVLFSHFVAAWGFVMRTLQDPTFPLAVAQSYVVTDYHLLGFVCMTCPTVEDAMHALSRYGGLWMDSPGWEVTTEPEDQGRAVGLSYVGYESSDVGHRAAQECGLAEFVHAARQATRQPLRPVLARLDHKIPGGEGYLEEFFGSPVTAEQSRSLLVFDRKTAELPAVGADPALANYLREQAERVLEQKRDAPDVVGTVRAEVLAILPQQVPTLARVAARLGIGERTLRRRLADAGLTFREVLDSARADLAMEYLQENRFSLQEVAFLLGFSEPSGFFRAFRRWHGMTPQAFRSAKCPEPN